MKRTPILSAALLAAAFLAVGLPGAALAAPPSNDDFMNATAIDPGATAFTGSTSVSEATTETDEPQWCSYSPHTVWYSIAPSSDETIRVDLLGSSFSDTQLNVYRQNSSGLAGLSFVSCGSYYGNGVTFTAEAGQMYYVQGSDIFGGGGTLNLNLQVIPPPPNDLFGSAIAVGQLPFSDSEDITAAGMEAGEPSPACVGLQMTKTVWYSLTAQSSGSLRVDPEAPFSADVAVYSGTSLADLTPIGCTSYGGGFTFHVDAGTTYYFQAGVNGASGQLQVNIMVAPPPAVGFFFSPADPSAFDTVQFYDQTYDPGGPGLQSEVWSFGDGTSQTNPGAYPTHKYPSDGDYTVTLTATTADGRKGSAQQIVHVRTHDVAIAKLGVPQSANVGQTRSISVGISNKRYAENVQVQLYKSGPSGFELVGTLQQNVPVRNGGRTTDFNFSYTFTSADKSLGKVTFKAVASLIGARDALPADNEAVALPTKVG
jgi:hypothetical protein